MYIHKHGRMPNRAHNRVTAAYIRINIHIYIHMYMFRLFQCGGCVCEGFVSTTHRTAARMISEIGRPEPQQG